MPRKKTKATETQPSVVPEYIQQSRLLQRRKLNKRKLPSYTEAMMLLHAPEAQRLFWKALLEGLTNGDKEAVRMTGEVFDLLKRGGGFTITQQLFQQNAVAGPTSPVLGFDALVRRIAEAKAGHALPMPTEDAAIVDVHPVDTASGV